MSKSNISDQEIEAARKEFWRVIAIKELTLENAWRATLEAAYKVREELKAKD